MTTRHILILAVVLFTLATKFWGLGAVTSYMEDEPTHIMAAKNYAERGHKIPDNWYHPPLSLVLLSASMDLFGDNAIGWRIRNACFGFLSILLIYFLGQALYADERSSILAAALLATDPLHMFYARSTYEEPLAVLFTGFFLYTLIRSVRGGYFWLILSGICIGLALSSKWYFIPLAPAAAVYAIVQKTRSDGWNTATAVNIVLVFTCVPFCIYLGTYYHWFGRGYTLMEFARMQIDAFRELQSLTAESYRYISQVDPGTPSTWFLKPHMVVGGGFEQDPAHTRYHALMTGIVVSLLTLPSLAYSLFRAWSARSEYTSDAAPSGPRPDSLLLPAVAFLLIYAPMLLTKRPIFLYSMIPLLPWAYLMIAFFFIWILQQLKCREGGFSVLILIILLWGSYLFPLITGQPVPNALYAPFMGLFSP